MSRVKLFALVVWSLAMLGHACTSTSDGAQSEIPVSAKSDDKYAAALEKWQREAHVFNQFQKRADATVVLMTEEFRRAYLERWKSIRGDSKSSLDEMTSGKLGLFVSIYTPEYPYISLDNAKLWSHQLQFGDKSLAPIQVRALTEKSTFEPYFPFISHWSREFLVVFETASPTGESLVLPSSVTYSLKSALVNLEFTWK